jgi:hypothetical protein
VNIFRIENKGNLEEFFNVPWILLLEYKFYMVSNFPQNILMAEVATFEIKGLKFVFFLPPPPSLNRKAPKNKEFCFTA